jgi:hypothetical protein
VSLAVSNRALNVSGTIKTAASIALAITIQALTPAARFLGPVAIAIANRAVNASESVKTAVSRSFAVLAQALAPKASFLTKSIAAISAQALNAAGAIKTTATIIYAATSPLVAVTARFIGKASASIAAKAFTPASRFIGHASAAISTQALTLLTAIKTSVTATYTILSRAFAVASRLIPTAQLAATLTKLVAAATASTSMTKQVVFLVVSQAATTVQTIKLGAISTYAITAKAFTSAARFLAKASVTITARALGATARFIGKATASIAAIALLAAAPVKTAATLAYAIIGRAVTPAARFVSKPLLVILSPAVAASFISLFRVSRNVAFATISQAINVIAAVKVRISAAGAILNQALTPSARLIARIAASISTSRLASLGVLVRKPIIAVTIIGLAINSTTKALVATAVSVTHQTVTVLANLAGKLPAQVTMQLTALGLSGIGPFIAQGAMTLMAPVVTTIQAIRQFAQSVLSALQTTIASLLGYRAPVFAMLGERTGFNRYFTVTLADNGKVLGFPLSPVNRGYNDFTGVVATLCLRDQNHNLTTRPLTWNTITQQWEYSVVPGDFAIGRWHAAVALMFPGPVGPVYSSEVVFDVVAADAAAA